MDVSVIASAVDFILFTIEESDDSVDGTYQMTTLKDEVTKV